MMETRLGIVSQRRLVKEKHRLQLLEQELKAASPENLLKRGYSITLKKWQGGDRCFCIAAG